MKNASRLMDIIDRSFSGELQDEKEFDLQTVAMGVRKKLKKYKIKFDRSRIIQTDDEMNDRLWQAAIEFFEECGVYNTSTHRVMKFTRREIDEALQALPESVVLGAGNDARRETPRKVEDPRKPLVLAGPIGTELTEDMYVPILQSYMQEPIVDMFTPGTLQTTRGRVPRTKSPLEIVGAWQEVEGIMTALRRVGRPGMSIGSVQMGLSDLGHLSAISHGGYRPTDFQMIALVGEMKTNNELLNKLAHTVCTNGISHGFYNPIYGGLAGADEGVALLLVAGFIAMQMIYMSVQFSTCPTHANYFNDTAPQCIRALSAAQTAVSRNSRMMTIVMTSPIGGPCTDTVLYECVAMAATASACGCTQVFGTRSAVGVRANHCTGLEARWNGEVGHAAAGLSRELVNEIVMKAISKYEHLQTGEKPIGKPFCEAYDMVTLKPTDEWLGIYDRVKAEVREWGLPLQ